MSNSVYSRLAQTVSELRSSPGDRDAKILSGFGGAGVVEVVKDYCGDTFRAVYTVRFAGTLYVLHVFQKKSKSVRETPRNAVPLIKQRLKIAERMAKGINDDEQ